MQRYKDRSVRVLVEARTLIAWNAIAMLYLDKHGKGKDYDIK
jgi:hypothetical protein